MTSERVHIHRDSRITYDLELSDHADPAIDVDEATTDRWVRVIREFEVVQDEMQLAYAEAVRRDNAAAEVRNAERAVAEAEARLEQIRYEQEHPLDDPESWPGKPTNVCRGARYLSEKKAWDGRVYVYDTVARRGGTMPFDIEPYSCDLGHWHLGRVGS